MYQSFQFSSIQFWWINRTHFTIHDGIGHFCKLAYSESQLRMRDINEASSMIRGSVDRTLGIHPRYVSVDSVP